MSLLDSLRTLVGRGSRYEHQVYVGPTAAEVLDMSAADLFRTQPHLRTVITFVARNIAQLPVHAFERRDNNDRRRLIDDPLAQLMSMPNEGMTGFELIYRLVADLKLYDVAVWMLVESADMPSGFKLLPIPYNWIQATAGGTAWAPEYLEVIRPGGARVPLRNRPGKRPEFILFHGYNPGDLNGWVSPVQSLKEILAEQIQAWSYRQQVWAKGGRVGAYITRPVGAPTWAPESRTKFQRDWKDKWAGKDAPEGGGTPLFEDGMELKSVRFGAREEEWSEVAKLALATVAGVYHTSPTMVGLLDNANYSNVREFKQMLYTDTLGPDLAMIEARLNAFLVPWVAASPRAYVEFNVQEKLQGSFEEQAAVLSTSIGRPWMTADEGRARMNMPALGGDAEQLVTPLNVLVGGQASPRDSAPPPKAAPELPRAKAAAQLTREAADSPLRVKAEHRPEDLALVEETLKRFFQRQRSVVLARLGAKSPDWWDEERWNKELAEDLYQLAMKVTAEVGAETLSELGVEPSLYSPEQTEAFLRAVAESRAGAVNSTTMAQIEAALDGDLSDDAEGSTPEGVFELAESSRLGTAAVTMLTTLTAFAVGEAARQLGRPATTKTWVVTSTNPRASHASMNGETVNVSDRFSNGADWPGDAVLGADGVAGCMCSVEITIP